MFDTIKEMYALLFEFIGKILEIFGYKFEDGKFVEIAE